MRFILLNLIRVYRLCISPLLPAACRFTPTCSDYAAGAVKTHGAIKGSLLSLRRIARCHPWGQSGFDPIPCRHKAGAHE